MKPSLFLAIAIATTLTACREKQLPRSITIGAAANLAEAFPQVGREFERQTGIHALFSFASTAQLARQIENSAPFDVFAAAARESCYGRGPHLSRDELHRSKVSRGRDREEADSHEQP